MARGRQTRAAAPVATAEEARDMPPLPAAVRLIAEHGFIEDEHGKGVFHWRVGEIVRRPQTIRLLIDRGALLEEVEP